MADASGQQAALAQVALRCTALVKSYSIGADQPPALAGVDLEIKSGRLHVLLGEIGAGRSTLVKVVAGLVRPDSPQLAFDIQTGKLKPDTSGTYANASAKVDGSTVTADSKATFNAGPLITFDSTNISNYDF